MRNYPDGRSRHNDKQRRAFGRVLAHAQCQHYERNHHRSAADAEQCRKDTNQETEECNSRKADGR
jgi:hypothetical protein